MPNFVSLSPSYFISVPKVDAVRSLTMQGRSQRGAKGVPLFQDYNFEL